MDEEYMTVGQARDYLGVNKVRMSDFLRKGELETFERGLDRRIKWVRRTDVEALKKRLYELRPTDQGKPLPAAA